MPSFLRSSLLSCLLVCTGFAAPARPFAILPLANVRTLAVDSTGNLLVGDLGTTKIYRITPAGIVTLLATGEPPFTAPIAVAAGRDGAVVVADSNARTVYRIAPDGTVTDPGRAPGAPPLSSPTGVAVDDQGNIFVVNPSGSNLFKFTPRGGLLLTGRAGETGGTDGSLAVARFDKPRGIAIDPAGNIYVADEGNHTIRKVTPAGVVSTLAGTAGAVGSTDGTGALARFGAPRGLAVDAAGTVYVADTDNHTIRRITRSGTVTTPAGRAGEAGTADGPGTLARFNKPRGIAVDTSGNVYIADTDNHTIRLITPTGLVTTIAGPVRP